MSTNCSRTSFCDYSAGRTKSVFYTAAVLHRERRRADQIPRYCATEHTSFVLVKIFFWNIINQWIILASTESISIDFHLDNDTHSMQRRHWMLNVNGDSQQDVCLLLELFFVNSKSLRSRMLYQNINFTSIIFVSMTNKYAQRVLLWGIEFF